MALRQAKTPILIERYEEGEEDAHGNPTQGYGDPEAALVFGVAPKTSDEPFEAGRPSIETVTHEVYAPFGFPLSSRDRVTYLGEVYEVDGPRKDWENGPYSGDRPGSVFELKRVGG